MKRTSLGSAFLILSLLFLIQYSYGGMQSPSNDVNPVRIGVVGLVHDHVHGILGRGKKGDIEIVGIAEPDRALAEKYARQYGFSMDMVYPTLEEMLKKTRPQAVTVFTSIYDHLEVVQKCAPLGIHVMVEKPLAVNLDHALKMQTLAKENHILLLTNYETTWYGSNHKVFDMAVKENKLGELRKMVIHDGHQGPIEIGCSKAFTDWLCDPKYNGAGALMDFGCYGANLSTWFTQGQRPDKVMAITQHFKPDVYPKVDDEATIIVTYPRSQTIIQASWNWPFSRKDMEVYGVSGYADALDGITVKTRLAEENEASTQKAEPLSSPQNDPFALLAALVLKKIKLEPFDPTSLENNMIVMEILEAAKRSAESGKVVVLPIK